MRLTLNTIKIGLLGYDAAEYFRKNGVEPELSDKDKVVFIATPMNSKADFIRLKYAIKTLPHGECVQNETPIFALFSTSKSVEVRDSLGKISANTICPCPPGIPILMPGEVITENSIKNLLYYGIFSIDVIK